MKKILIIADGVLAKHFLDRVASVSGDSNDYTVVYYRKKKTLPNIVFPENFSLHEFDPTSFEKIGGVLKGEYYQVMIACAKKQDALGAYKNVRGFNKKILIYMIDRWGLKLPEDRHLVLIESRQIAALRFADYLPNTPVIAQNVGLGIGEVMDVQVPVGSSYVYRHIGGIDQKRWQIAALYRNNTLILPRHSLMIQPNDTLLIVGAPEILQDVYKSIKQELGQFPMPFGNNTYCFINMRTMSDARIEKLLEASKFLHETLNSKKLYIKVINPTYSSAFEAIKKIGSDDIEVIIDYHHSNINGIYKDDTQKLNIGLCVCDREFFAANTKILFEVKTPIFKTGSAKFDSVKRGVILGGNIDEAEKNSSVVFDLSSQLNLKVELYDFDPDKEHEALSEHFENIAKLYEKKVDIIAAAEKNPIFEFRKADDVLHFVPFYHSLTKSKIVAMFSENFNRLQFLLNDKYQLFLPILE